MVGVCKLTIWLLLILQDIKGVVVMIKCGDCRHCILDVSMHPYCEKKFFIKDIEIRHDCIDFIEFYTGIAGNGKQKRKRKW